MAAAGRRARQMRLIPAEALRALYAKSDWRGAWRTLAHAALLVIGAVLIEDDRLTSSVPRGLRAALPAQGRFLVKREHLVIHFQKLVVSALA
jgi:hypothetical protein